MENVSITLSILFIVTTVLTVFLFYKASNNSKKLLTIILIWMVIQFVLGKSGYFLNELAKPPRFIFLIIPPIIAIICLFIFTSGRIFLDNLNIKQLTLLHTIRIPIEVVLYNLYLAQAIPKIMTFEGSNFDILVGLSAPIIYYLAFIKKSISPKSLMVWNIVSLALLINIVYIAILSSKTPFQQFGLDQPNIAIANFPFNWLPSVVVPIVLISHLATLRQLITAKASLNQIIST